MSDYDVIPEGTEHVSGVSYVPEPDGFILIPEGSEHVQVPAVVEVVEPPKNLGGRPPVFTEQKQEQYLARLREGDGRELAARNIDVSPNTVRVHRKAFPEFEAEMVAAEGEANQLIERAAVKTALDGNATMLIFLMTNRMPEKYQDRRGPRVLQQINAGPSVEWSLQEARAEALGIIDEIDAKRRQKEAAAAEAIDVASTEVGDGNS